MTPRLWSLPAALILLLLLQGCVTIPVPMRMAAEDEGMVALYLQPFLPDAERIRFALEGIRAVREDGAEFPLPLAMAAFKGSDMKQQRLLAAGPLPEGEYLGLSCMVKSASVNREDGEASLLLPDAPVRINFPFKVVRKKKEVLSLTFNYARSVKDGFRFTLFFSVVLPDRPIMAVTGYVSGADTLTVFDKNRSRLPVRSPRGAVSGWSRWTSCAGGPMERPPPRIPSWSSIWPRARSRTASG